MKHIGYVQRRLVGVFCAMVVIAVSCPATAAVCRAESGDRRVPLVELYTSEGCSSCPPADKALSALVRSGAVVPLAMHVDYWDSLGWKDRFAQSAFTSRQQWEVHANGHATPFTPHFFVDGGEIEDWRSDLGGRVRGSSRAAPVRVAIDAQSAGSGRLRVHVDATLTDPAAAHGPLTLVTVVTDSGLSSQVAAGENRGVRLAHDAVARQWLGDVPLARNKATLERVIDVPELARGQISIVAFVQNTHDASVLQAVSTGFCKAD